MSMSQSNKLPDIVALTTQMISSYYYGCHSLAFSMWT